MEKRFAQIVDSRVKNFVVSIDDEINEDWLSRNVGGFWVEVADGVSVGKGMTYDSENNGFYGESPFPSWTLNTTTFEWEPPVPKPSDWKTKPYLWNEQNQSWDLFSEV